MSRNGESYRILLRFLRVSLVLMASCTTYISLTEILFCVVTPVADLKCQTSQFMIFISTPWYLFRVTIGTVGRSALISTSFLFVLPFILTLFALQRMFLQWTCPAIQMSFFHSAVIVKQVFSSLIDNSASRPLGVSGEEWDSFHAIIFLCGLIDA